MTMILIFTFGNVCPIEIPSDDGLGLKCHQLALPMVFRPHGFTTYAIDDIIIPSVTLFMLVTTTIFYYSACY